MRARPAKERSVHNNYLTLPVIFLMISNHYPLLFATRYNWLIGVDRGSRWARSSGISSMQGTRGKESPWWVWARRPAA